MNRRAGSGILPNAFLHSFAQCFIRKKKEHMHYGSNKWDKTGTSEESKSGCIYIHVNKLIDTIIMMTIEFVN